MVKCGACPGWRRLAHNVSAHVAAAGAGVPVRGAGGVGGHGPWFDFMVQLDIRVRRVGRARTSPGPGGWSAHVGVAVGVAVSSFGQGRVGVVVRGSGMLSVLVNQLPSCCQQTWISLEELLVHRLRLSRAGASPRTVGVRERRLGSPIKSVRSSGPAPGGPSLRRGRGCLPPRRAVGLMVRVPARTLPTLRTPPPMGMAPSPD